MAFWRKRQGEHGPRECFQFSHYLGGGRGKELRVAEYPMETVQTDRIGVPTRSKKRGRKGQGKRSQKDPGPRAATAENRQSATVMSEPTAPAWAAGPLPLHSYNQWPPAPTADGTGPMDEIRLHNQRMELERSRRADLRTAPAPVIDPTLLTTPERSVQLPNPNFIGSQSVATPSRRVMEVLLTPRRRLTVAQGQQFTPPAPSTPRNTRSQTHNLQGQANVSSIGRPPRPRPQQRAGRRVAIARDDSPGATPGSSTAPSLRPRPRIRQTASTLPENSDAFFIRNRRAH